jgi:hypothetical protein
MGLTRRRIWLTVGALAVVAVLAVASFAVRTVLRSRSLPAEAGSARRPRIPPDPPRLDVRQRSQLTPAPQVLEGLPIDTADPLSFARDTAAEYRQRARYPSWSQPIAGAKDPLEEEQQQVSGAAAVGAQLTGQYRDAIDDGDLTIDAQVDVAVHGRFHIEASLYSADGTRPIAWAQHTAELPIGRHWLRLRFYGLIVRERAIDGPYLLRSIGLSSLTQFPAVKGPLARRVHITDTYAANGFTDRSFDDPDLLEAADRIEQALEGLQPEAGS